MILMNLASASDEQLWHLACEGDRDAFNRIVVRYQSLICSLAYSACGALGASEDMAQETFITAWHRLKELRDPNKLRQWLCGIARNIAANALRRELRRGGQPESLEVISEEPSFENDPAALAVTREEEALLWRTLATLPEKYREPIVLFYRQEQSVTEVANSLDLSEETVRQRLSRGRTMLREEMTTLVESTLKRTRPGAAFTLAVMVALPAASVSSASAALTAGAIATRSAGTTGKGLWLKLGLGALVGPLIGLLLGYLGTKAAASRARSELERKCIVRHARWLIAFCFAMSLGLAAALSQAGKLYNASAPWIVFGVCSWTAALVWGVVLVSRHMEREVVRIRNQTNTADDGYGKTVSKL